MVRARVCVVVVGEPHQLLSELRHLGTVLHTIDQRLDHSSTVSTSICGLSRQRLCSGAYYLGAEDFVDGSTGQLGLIRLQLLDPLIETINHHLRVAHSAQFSGDPAQLAA